MTQRCAVEVIPQKLYYAMIPELDAAPNVRLKTSQLPILSNVDVEMQIWIPIDEYTEYQPFFLDFGPSSLKYLYRFYVMLKSQLEKKDLADTRIVVYSGAMMNKRVNSVCLVGAFCVLYYGKSPEEALMPFRSLTLAPFHDASQGRDTFNLTCLDVCRGIQRAKENKFFDFATFDVDECDYYEAIENGDMNWIVYGRFLAFVGPHDVAQTTREGYYVCSVHDVIPYFKRKGVTAVIRLNEPLYDAQHFERAGIKHYDLFFPDGSNPCVNTLNKFLRICESTQGAIAVHCKAGLGRTGTLIGSYIIKHYGFTAREAIGWMRICRPGSVIGEQQQYLELMQNNLWYEGKGFRDFNKVLPNPAPNSPLFSVNISPNHYNYHLNGTQNNFSSSGNAQQNTLAQSMQRSPDKAPHTLSSFASPAKAPSSPSRFSLSSPYSMSSPIRKAPSPLTRAGLSWTSTPSSVSAVSSVSVTEFSTPTRKSRTGDITHLSSPVPFSPSRRVEQGLSPSSTAKHLFMNRLSSNPDSRSSNSQGDLLRLAKSSPSRFKLS